MTIAQEMHAARMRLRNARRRLDNAKSRRQVEAILRAALRDWQMSGCKYDLKFWLRRRKGV